jgi:hypothetical protein
MMTTVIFVHGTGVRKDNYDQSFKQIEKELTKRRSDLIVSDCYWGQFGVQLRANGASIPEYNSTRSLTEQSITDDDNMVALWDLLYRDPLYELRLLSLRADESGDMSPRQRSPGQKLRKKLDELPAVSEMKQKLPELEKKLTQAGIASVFDNAVQAILNSAPFNDAIDSAPQELNHYRTATARAIVAQAIFLNKQQRVLPILITDADLRDEIVAELELALGNSTRGMVFDLLKLTLIGLSFHAVSSYTTRHRGALTDKTSRAVGDILLYQTRGAEIRNFIRDTIQKAEGPVILLAHSLGGIISVDLLINEDLPQVESLITVGSQSPFFYEINALQSLHFEDIPADERLPAHFPTWLNVYDRRDFLSYIGANIFGPKVIDIEVDNRQPFPYSHSAYWSNQTMWDTIIKKL